jgi:hypothetical protein
MQPAKKTINLLNTINTINPEIDKLRELADAFTNELPEIGKHLGIDTTGMVSQVQQLTAEINRTDKTGVEQRAAKAAFLDGVLGLISRITNGEDHSNSQAVYMSVNDYWAPWGVA